MEKILAEENNNIEADMQQRREIINKNSILLVSISTTSDIVKQTSSPGSIV
jgi:hypothetical protein